MSAGHDEAEKAPRQRNRRAALLEIRRKDVALEMVHRHERRADARLVDARDYKRQLITCSAVKKRFFTHHLLASFLLRVKICHGSESC